MMSLLLKLVKWNYAVKACSIGFKQYEETRNNLDILDRMQNAGTDAEQLEL